MPHTFHTHTPRPPWKTCSLVLLAALTLGSTGTLLAQTTSSPRGPGTPRQSMPLGSDRKAEDAPTAQHFSFQRVDANRDGYLTQEEAQKLPAIAANFANMDKDGDGRISEQEFLNHSGEGSATGAGNRSGLEKAPFDSATGTPGGTPGPRQ